MKVAQFPLYFKEFAHPQAVVFGQALLFTFGVFFSSKTNTSIFISCPKTTELIMAILFGFFCGAASFLSSRKFSFWKKMLDWMFSPKLNKYGSLWALFVMPAIVAIGEETFFRGFLLPNIGFISTTFLFSIYHIRANQKSIMLATIAYVLGLMLGVAYLNTRNLVIPIVAHFFILFFVGYGFNMLKEGKK